MRTIVSLQYVRAIAAIAVVIHHFVSSAYFDAGLGLQGTLGEVGVDLFFVVSGFIMWTTTRRRETEPADFICHRLVRIVPLYWLFSVVYLVTMLPRQHEPVSALDFVRSLLFVPWYEEHLSQKTSAFYFLGWTLMYEMFFYVLFALCLYARRELQFASITLSLLLLVTMGFLFDFKHGVSFTYTSPLLLEFAVGCAIGRLSELQRLPATSAGLILIATAAAMFIPTIWLVPDTLAVRALVWGVPASLTVLGGLSLEKVARENASRYLVLLGDASYSIYLSHFITFLVFNSLVKRSGLVQGVAPSIAIYGIIGASIAVGVGVAVHVLIERPLLQFLRTRLMSASKAAAPIG
ncbi:acyltransferase family protein [Bradyrhizobium sp. USDA 4486]